MRLFAPYKITRTDLPDNTILLKGRAPTSGFEAIIFIPIVILFVAFSIAMLFDQERLMRYVIVGLSVPLILSLFGRFSIRISPSFITISKSCLGTTQDYVHVPFSQVRVMWDGMEYINKDTSGDNGGNKDSYLFLTYGADFEHLSLHVCCRYCGKEIVFNGNVDSFEKELLQVLTAAIKETYELKVKSRASE